MLFVDTFILKLRSVREPSRSKNYVGKAHEPNRAVLAAAGHR